MDPRMHIPVDDKPVVPNRGVTKLFLGVSSVLVFTIVVLVGYIFYRDYYRDNMSPLEMNTNTGAQSASSGSEVDFETAKKLIVEGMAKWDDLDYVGYKVTGDDGDEEGRFYIEEHYKYDNIKDEFSLWRYFPCESEYLEEPPYSRCWIGSGYVKKENELYFIDDSETKEVEAFDEFQIDFDLESIVESVNSSLSFNPNVFNTKALVYEGAYGYLSNGNATFVDIIWVSKPVDNSLSSLFKVYADIPKDKYRIEAVIDENGMIQELIIPRGWSSVRLSDFSYNEPIEIELPGQD